MSNIMELLPREKSISGSCSLGEGGGGTPVQGGGGYDGEPPPPLQGTEMGRDSLVSPQGGESETYCSRLSSL